MNKLVYNVYMEDFNNKEIVIYNIFDHYTFLKSLCDSKKEAGDNFLVFEEYVKSDLMYCFWSKSEYEIVLTSWPPYVEEDEINRLVAEKEEHIRKYGNFYRETVRLMVGEKVDIYDQVMLNWDIFIKYLWDNRNLIKKVK